MVGSSTTICFTSVSGLCPETLELVRAPCLALMDSVATEGFADLRLIPPEVVTRFITREGEHYSRGTLQGRCSLLRGFLSYLYRRQVISVDLSAAVVAPRVYQDEPCPRFLTRAEIDAVLAVTDRKTPVGRRDYAMISLLATTACAASKSFASAWTKSTGGGRSSRSAGGKPTTTRPIPCPPRSATPSSPICGTGDRKALSGASS
jgi:site-specific recombinase XerD